MEQTLARPSLNSLVKFGHHPVISSGTRNLSPRIEGGGGGLLQQIRNRIHKHIRTHTYTWTHNNECTNPPTHPHTHILSFMGWFAFSCIRSNPNAVTGIYIGNDKGKNTCFISLSSIKQNADRAPRSARHKPLLIFSSFNIGFLSARSITAWHECAFASVQGQLNLNRFEHFVIKSRIRRRPNDKARVSLAAKTFPANFHLFTTRRGIYLFMVQIIKQNKTIKDKYGK